MITLAGPRQAGKSTLARTLFPNKPYVSLEDLDQRAFAQEDPRGFLQNYEEGAIIDEVQRCPDLISYIQTKVDQKRQAGFFVLTGSAQLNLLSAVSQSLAGRTAIFNLLPFSFSELKNRGGERQSRSLGEVLPWNRIDDLIQEVTALTSP